jgi:NitT/TauT family transport system permease protein
VDRTAAPRLIGGLAGLAYYASLAAIAAAAAWYALHFLTAFEAAEWLHVFALGALTLVRVLVVTALAMLVWVPVGVIIGLQPAWTTRVQPIVQFLAAIPVNLVFPLAVYAIVHLRLNPDIWLSPLIVLGAQWYILFNVIAGTSTIPQDLLEISRNLQVKGWLRWHNVLLPGVAPHAITGALTAWGGAWKRRSSPKSCTGATSGWLHTDWAPT